MNNQHIIIVLIAEKNPHKSVNTSSKRLTKYNE